MNDAGKWASKQPRAALGEAKKWRQARSPASCFSTRVEASQMQGQIMPPAVAPLDGRHFVHRCEVCTFEKKFKSRNIFFQWRYGSDIASSESYSILHEPTKSWMRNASHENSRSRSKRRSFYGKENSTTISQYIITCHWIKSVRKCVCSPYIRIHILITADQYRSTVYIWSEDVTGSTSWYFYSLAVDRRCHSLAAADDAAQPPKYAARKIQKLRSQRSIGRCPAEATSFRDDSKTPAKDWKTLSKDRMRQRQRWKCGG